MLRKKSNFVGVMLLCSSSLFICSKALAFLPCENPDDFGVVLYHMNEDANSVLFDSALGDGDAGDGSILGVMPPTWIPSRFGSGLQLNGGPNYGTRGAKGYVDLPTVLFSTTNDLTVEMYLNWDYRTEFYFPGDNNLGELVKDVETFQIRGHLASPAVSGLPDWTCYLKVSLRLGGVWADFDTMNPPNFNPQYNLVAGEWTHVAAVRDYDAATGITTGKLYINGELAASRSAPHTPWLAGTDTWIGDPQGNAVTWAGKIDEFRVTHAALEPEDFGCPECGDWGYHTGDIDQDCYVEKGDTRVMGEQWLGTGKNIFGAPYFKDSQTLALWYMNENSGTMVMDSSGNGHHGTFVGGHPPTWSAGLLGASGVQLNQEKFAPNSAQGTGSGILFPTSLTNRSDFTFQCNFKWDGGSGFIIPADNYAGHLYRDFFSFEVRFHAYDANNAYFRALHRFDDDWHEVLYHTSTVTGGGTGIIEAGTWYELTYTRELLVNPADPNDGTEIKIFIDGVEQVAAIIPTNAGSYTTGVDAGFGHVQVSTNYVIPGEIDEARILDYAVTLPLSGPCGGAEYLDADIDQDCGVRYDDFSHLERDFGKCTDPADPGNCVDCGSVTVSEFSLDGDTLALWHMNEGAGTAIADATGTYPMTNDPNGLGEGFIWTSGQFGGGLTSKLSPDLSYAAAGPLPLTAGDPDVIELTVSAWVYVNSNTISSEGSYILNIDNVALIRVNSDGDDIAVAFHTKADPDWLETSYTPFGGALVNSTAALATGWHHVAAVYDGNMDGNDQIRIRMFWDGVEVKSNVMDAAPGTFPGGQVGLQASSGMVFVGIQADKNPNTAYYGSVDEVRISDVIRTSFFPGACN